MILNTDKLIKEIFLINELKIYNEYIHIDPID